VGELAGRFVGEPLERYQLVAHHEAAHAALAHLFSLRLRAVWIDPESGDGMTELLEGQHATRLQHALILLAGSRAEKVLDATSVYHRTAALRDQAEFEQLVLEAPFMRG
jgi:hypothetical protein